MLIIHTSTQVRFWLQDFYVQWSISRFTSVKDLSTETIWMHTYDSVVLYCHVLCLLGDLPGRNPPQQTGPDATLQPARLTNQSRLELWAENVCCTAPSGWRVEASVWASPFLCLNRHLSHFLCYFSFSLCVPLCALMLATPMCHTWNTVSEVNKRFHKLFKVLKWAP